MPCTAIRIKKDDKIIRLKFITVAHEIYTDVDVYQCNEEFIPVGKPEMGVHKSLEHDYHTELRSEAAKLGQFVPEESTNPEWNPNIGEDTQRD